MELRHLRYFRAVVECNGYRKAAQQLHIAQPSISEAVSDLEEELGLKLFSRANRMARLTPEGEIFYTDTVRILQQAEDAVVTAKRAAQGKVGRLSIGFIGSATLSFLPDLIRRYKLEYPDVRLELKDLYPVELDDALDHGAIDIAITRSLSLERSKKFQSRVLLRDPLVAVLPLSRSLKKKTIRLADLANERFLLFNRRGAPGVFDMIVGACRSEGFSPHVENEPNSMQTILSLVEAEEGVAIVPASTSNLRSNGVQFVRLAPNNLYLDLIAAWPTDEPSIVLRSFLEFLNRNSDLIRKKAELGRRATDAKQSVAQI
ncbi:LysR substrate-binding domain-containing protein [Terriglobus sp. TAA 43]|uniref:LysR substrate-binding domain-containing protein n=1 Tax=Terriglobus sp. TAA 43 TaxID=278961 RepID=UPI0006910135|nr:LysR substrate-binding domain-containing protein [Terriglobus sp. TAA 43]